MSEKLNEQFITTSMIIWTIVTSSAAQGWLNISQDMKQTCIDKYKCINNSGYP